MKKSLMFAACCAGAALMTGCMATHTNDATAVVKFNIEEQKYQPSVVTGSEIVSGEATLHSVFGFINWGVYDFADEAFNSTSNVLPFQFGISPATAVKQGAAYNACVANDADAILAAKYNLEIADYIVYKRIKAKVSGYPAKVAGIK